MLNNDSKTEENGGAPASATPSSPAKVPHCLEPSAEEAAQAVRHALFGGANDFTSSDWQEFLTSPFLDDEPTPFDPMLDTPAVGMQDFFTSPVVADAGPNALGVDFPDMPLFSQPASAAYQENNNGFAKMSLESAPTPSSVASGSVSPMKPSIPSFDGLYTMSPATPALDPTSAQSSPFVADVAMASPNTAVGGRKKKVATGTRKGVTPEALVPLDAPTQPRSYLMPSATSRKAVPAVFARKRARSAAFDEEDDELAGSEDGAADGPVSTAEADAIAAKRRQNTLAARRSRKRKLEYQRELEESLEAERREKEMWRERAMMLRTQVMQFGVPDPFRDS